MAKKAGLPKKENLLNRPQRAIENLAKMGTKFSAETVSI
jgi:hypothetical protein